MIIPIQCGGKRKFMLGENAARASIGLMNIFRIQLGNKAVCHESA